MLPGHISVHTGRPSPSSSTARIIWRRSGRSSLELPCRPSVYPPAPSKYRLVVSMNMRSSLVNRSRRLSNRRSSTTSLRQRGANGVRPSCSAAGPQEPFQLPTLAQVFDTPERGDHLLVDLRAFATAFDDLQIGTTAGGLLAEVHGRLIPSQHMISF